MNKVFLIMFVSCLLGLVAFSQDSDEMGKPDLFGPEFQKRFTASYGVLEDREPELQELEIVLLEEIGPMVEENPEFAKSMLEGMLGDDSEATATFNFILANLYFNGDAMESAMEEYDLAIGKYPAFRRAWKNLGLLKVRNGDYEGGLKALVRCVELGDTSPDTYGSAAYSHLRVGNLMAAELAYNAAIVLDPNNIEWIEGKAEAMIQGKRFADARPLLLELIKRNPDKAAYRMFLANIHVELGEFIEAAQVFELIHAMGEGNGDTQLQLANIYSVSGMYELSVDTFLAATPKQLESHINQVMIGVKYLLDQEEFEQSRRLFRKIDGIGDTWSSDQRTRYLLLEAGFARVAENRELLKEKLVEALENDPLNGDVLVQLGSLYAEYENNAKAMFYFERAYGSEDYEYDALILASQMLISENRYEDSLALLRRASQTHSSTGLKALMERVQAASLQ
jgi:tetratricopeptide (TPR) repeat protein